MMFKVLRLAQEERGRANGPNRDPYAATFFDDGRSRRVRWVHDVGRGEGTAMNKAIGMMGATVVILAALAAWPSGRAGNVSSAPGCEPFAPSPEFPTPAEALAASHVLDRDGLARERRLVGAAQAYANARLNCTVDAASADWTTSLWREEAGWRVAFRTISALIPDDPHVYMIGVDLDDDAKAVGADVLFR
jgi:hypothetical protein